MDYTDSHGFCFGGGRVFIGDWGLVCMVCEILGRQVIDENGHVVEEYRGGKEASLNFLIGGVMRLSERRTDFKVVTEVMKRLIG